MMRPWRSIAGPLLGIAGHLLGIAGPLLGIAGVPLALAGCAGSPSARTFVLSTALDPRTYPVPAHAAPAVQVQAVALPDYLDTVEILVRTGAHELQASATGRWGERLSAGIAHDLAAALVIGLPEDRIEPARPRDNAARQVLVDVEALDVWRDGHCALSASWTILERGTGTVVVADRGLFTTPPMSIASVPDDAAVVAAVARAVRELASALIAAVRIPASPPSAAANDHPAPTRAEQ
jgi:uncharacterized lipoprotein YmbA